MFPHFYYGVNYIIKIRTNRAKKKNINDDDVPITTEAYEEVWLIANSVVKTGTPGVLREDSTDITL